MRIDSNNKPIELALYLANTSNNSKRSQKICPIAAPMGQKPCASLTGITTTSSSNNLKWENAKQACQDWKNLIQPPLLPRLMQGLQCWSKNEVKMRKKTNEAINRTKKHDPAGERKVDQTTTEQNRCESQIFTR